jgi:hypothetical protein
MKKVYWIIGIVLLVAIIALLVYVYYPKENSVNNNINLDSYPAVKDGSYLKTTVYYSRGEQDYNVELIRNISNGLLVYHNVADIAPVDWQPRINCANNVQIKITPLSSSSDAETGMFSRESIVECGNTYWVFADSGTGWFVYGPFEKV